MTQRLDYFKLSPELGKKYTEFSLLLRQGSIDATLRDLVTIRSSQLNGCAFCLDMHVKEAKIHGERELRVHHIAIWRESSLFTAREKAALAWTEILTRIPEHGVSDEAFAAVREHFSEKELADLTFQIVSINGWNRFGVAFRAEPGSLDKAYGLEKAGLN